MQTATADRIQLFVKNFANLVVCEIKRVAGTGGDQLRADAFVEGVEQHVFSLFSHGRELFEREDFPENGRHAQHFVTVLTDTIETIANRFLDALRDQHLLHIATTPASTLASH